MPARPGQGVLPPRAGCSRDRGSPRVQRGRRGNNGEASVRASVRPSVRWRPWRAMGSGEGCGRAAAGAPRVPLPDLSPARPRAPDGAAAPGTPRYPRYSPARAAAAPAGSAPRLATGGLGSPLSAGDSAAPRPLRLPLRSNTGNFAVVVVVIKKMTPWKYLGYRVPFLELYEVMMDRVIALKCAT